MVVHQTKRLSGSCEQRQALLGSWGQVEIIQFQEQERRSVRMRCKVATISLRVSATSSVESEAVCLEKDDAIKMGQCSKACAERTVWNI